MAADEGCRRKVVVDEVSGWLRILDDGSVDRRWTGMPEAGFLMTPVAPFITPRDGVTLHDLPGSPSVRLYLPAGSQQPRAEKLPVFLHFHGGGFCISHCSWFMYYQFYARLAASLPAVVVSVELPLAPEHRLPAAIDVAYAALLRLSDLARSGAPGPADALLHSAADFSQVFLIGDSSGGNLVHQVAARASAEAQEFWAPLRVAGGALLHPGFVRSTRSQSELEQQSDSVFFTLDMLDKFMKLGLPEGVTKDHFFGLAESGRQDYQRKRMWAICTGG